MQDHDRSDFIRFLKDFPKQPAAAIRKIKDAEPAVKLSSIRNIVVAGMGGSAIAGELLKSYLQEELKVPMMIHRDYGTPQYLDKHSLVFIVSYSGDTEEALSAFDQAMKKRAQVIAVSSGGDLAQRCEENQVSHFSIPSGYPPRQALGYLFFTLLGLCDKMGLCSEKSKDIHETSALLKEMVGRYNPETTFGNNLANHIAQSIYHAIPVIYIATPFFAGVEVRWRNQYNENSKTMAYSNIFPEVTHNEIVGWEALEEVTKHFRVIFLRDPEETARVKQRVEITKKILKGNNVLFGEVFAEGNSRLARMFSLIYTGDWSSYYLAMLNEQDPIKIDSIDLLKNRLGEVSV